MQVIVCDDDIENLNEMIKVCRDVMVKGTEVRGFSDARMLAESLQAHTVQPALMLLDIEMPELSGLELREQMASKLRMTDIIYVTSHEEMMEAAFGRNVIAFVRKTGNWAACAIISRRSMLSLPGIRCFATVSEERTSRRAMRRLWKMPFVRNYLCFQMRHSCFRDMMHRQ